jgi:hypothetical protein
MVLIKYIKGTKSGADQGILSNYITILNSFINYIQRHCDEINS